MRDDSIEQIDVRRLAFLRKALAEFAACVNHTRTGARRQRIERADGSARKGFCPSLFGQIKLVMRHRLIDWRAHRTFAGRCSAGLIMISHGREARIVDFVNLTIEADQTIRQIIENRIEALIKQRQPMFHSLMLTALRNGFVKRVFETRAAE